MAINTHIEAVIHFIEKMDAEMLSDLLDDERTYQDMHKVRFISLLDDAFIKLREEGNTGLTSHEGTCAHEDCINFEKPGYCFIGNNTKHHMDLIVETENERVTDIYECDTFHCPSKKLARKLTVWIDKGEEPF